MRIATVQMEMKWRSSENVKTILLTNEYAATIGTDMIIYPELAVTGYHREIREEIQTVLSNPPLIGDVAASAKVHEVYVWIGVPVEANGDLYNSYQCYGPDGSMVGEIRKNGLTTTEEILFTRGVDRPVIELGSYKVSSFLCRESADLSELATQFGTNIPDLLLWPGYIGNQSDPDPDNPEGTAEQACDISNSLSSYVVQSNWANVLNSPGQRDLGGSIVTDRRGSLLGRCPNGEPGIGFVDLQSGQFLWDSTYF